MGIFLIFSQKIHNYEQSVNSESPHSGGEESLGQKKYTRAHLLGQKSIQTCGSESKKSKSGAWRFLRKSIFKFLVFCGVNKTLYGSLQPQLSPLLLIF